MPRIFEPEPVEKVFVLATPYHMLMKLWWEIDQLQKSICQSRHRVDRLLPAYHAFNCALTAWHISDWVWESTDTDGRALLLSKFASNMKTGKASFQKGLKEQYRVLHICREIATGAKHKVVRRDFDPSVTVEERWGIIEVRGGKYAFDDLFIHDGGQIRPELRHKAPGHPPTGARE